VRSKDTAGREPREEMTMWRHTAGLIVMLTLGVLVVPLATNAQRPGKIPRIGFLGDTPGPHAEALHQGLHDVGYMEGQNLVIEYRWAEGKGERLPALAAELVQLPVDVIIAPGGQASRAAKHATSTIPIVMAPVGNPESLGLVASLARPGGNITGVSVIGVDVIGKQLELLKEAVPGISRVAVLLNPTNPGAAPGLRVLEGAARALELMLYPMEVRGADEFERAFAAIATAHPDALLVFQDYLLFSHRTRIVDFMAQARLPAIYMYREWADAGGLLAYGASLREVFRRVAVLVDKLLKGEKPEELPVEQVMRLDLVINLKTAQVLGLRIPPTVLFRADAVIK
jgi:putative tryptophan/tyrosine transport system substrate-binding protein